MGFYFGRKLIEVERPKQRFFARLNIHFGWFAVDGAFQVACELTLESKIEVDDVTVFLIVIGAQVALFNKINGPAYGSFAQDGFDLFYQAGTHNGEE